jgi:hypothetical protein
VIKMSHEENGGPVFHTCSSEGKPTLPVHQLTDKIQDILVFSEIKQVQEEKRQYRALKKDQEQQEVASPEQDSSSDDEDIKSTLKRKMSEYSIASSKDSGRLRKRDMAVDALKFATESWKKKHGWASTSSSEFVNTNTGGQYVIENMGHQQNKSTGKSGPTVIQPIPVTTPAVPSASGVFEVAKHASVCAVLALLHERRQSSGLTAETDLSLQNLALTTLTLGLKGSDTKQLVLHEMLVMKWMNGRSGKTNIYICRERE